MAKTTIHSDYIPDNAITSTKIAENSIGAREIATNAITTLYVADGSVTTVKIADDAITSAKLDTNIDIAGTFDVTGATTLDSTLSVSGDITGTLATAAQPNITSVGTLTGLTTTGDINFGDNDKAIFGAGSDLQIYHDGSTSYILDDGVGDLQLRSNNRIVIAKSPFEYMADFNVDGAVDLYYDNSKKLATTSTGIDVTGRVTADGLTSEGNSGTWAIQDNGYIQNFSRVGVNIIRASDASGILRFDTGGTTIRQRIASNGDISFYDDTGTSQALFWDASAESLGIGTTSPQVLNHISSGYSAPTGGIDSNIFSLISNSASAGSYAGLGLLAGNAAASFIHFGDTDDMNSGSLDYFHSDNSMQFRTNATERMRIDSSGAVGIGQVPETARFSGHDILQVGGRATLAGNDTVTSTGQTVLLDNLYYDASGTFQHRGDSRGVAMQFVEGQVIFSNSNQTTGTPTVTEAMRIDSSGKVHIGATTGTGILNVDGGAGEGSIYVEGTHSGSAITARLLASDGGAVFFGSSTNHDLRIQTGGTNRMFITTSGTMGFGMSPLGTNNGSAFFDGNVSSKDGFMTTGTDLTLLQPSAGNTIFVRDNGNESMRIDASGRLLVGLTGASGFGTLEATSFTTEGSCYLARSSGNVLVNATSLAYTEKLSISTTSGSQGIVIRQTDNDNAHDKIIFTNTNGIVGYIRTTGSSTTYATSSDYRLKENVDYNFNALDRVAQLKPARFNFIADADTTVDGFLAHEVQDIVPEAITGEKDAVDSEGNPEYQGIDQSKLVPLLTKAIQEQQTQIEALQSEINLLKGE